VLVERGFITEIEETELFNVAETSLDRAPKTDAREAACKMLSELRHEGLIDWRPPLASQIKPC
jgi:hypothetical protein